jgi:Tfp pilus assembly protein PilN
MKHLLNFVPTVTYRKGSSFMFKVIMAILYVVPLSLCFFMAYEYFVLEDLIERHTEMGDALEKRHAQFQKVLAERRPDLEELNSMRGRFLSYYQAMSGLSFSWTELFATLEGILPPEVRLTRIQVRPESVVRLRIAGQAGNLGAVTELLRRLYGLEAFHAPRLSKHQVIDGQKSSAVTFHLDVEYLPPVAIDSLVSVEVEP